MLPFLFVVGLWVVPIFVAYNIWAEKGGSPWVGGLMGLVLGWVGVIIAAVATPSGVTSLQSTERLKTCPMCAEDVKVAAKVCRFCGHEFPVLEKTSTSAKAERDEDGARPALSDGPHIFDGQEVNDPMEHAFGVLWGRISSGDTVYRERGEEWKLFAADQTNLLPPPGYRP